MFESYTGSSGVILDAIRTLFSWLDRAAFGLLEFFYQLFFNVASADLFSNDTIMKFYGRVQLIIGVYMMFLLAMTILKGIMNPDTFVGGKDGGGASKLITRIITALIMLTVLVPINIGNPRNEYETQIHNNGLLFGTLYSLQHRILANNTLGRLILGNDSTSTSYFSSEGQDTLKQSSRIFTSTVLKGFYRINLLDEDDRPKHEDGKDDAIFNENRVCQDIDDEVLAAYTRLDAKPGDIIGMVNATCEVDDGSMNVLQKALSVFSPKLAGKQRYVFTFMPLISTITAIIFAVILLSFTVDVAVRAVKLAVLRLLAPIPIISYMDPKGSKDNAFNSWVKTLSSTYLDLFIRLGVVYFVIFLIQDMIVNGVVINHGDGLVGILSLIIIWIGLFMFAKQAPKFIKEVLGVKNDSLGNVFGRAFGMTAVAGGMVGSAATGYRAAKEENNALHEGQTIRNGFRNVGSAIASAIGGGYVGAKALGGKDAGVTQVLQAQSQANARRASHSTAIGRLGSQTYGMFSGRGLSEKGNAELKANQDGFKAFKDYKTTLEDEALKKRDFYGKNKFAQGAAVNNEYNYQILSAAVERARSSGAATFDYSDGVHTYTGLRTDDFDPNVMNEVKSSQASAYADALLHAVQTNDQTFISANGTAHNAYLKAQKASSDLKYTSADFDGTYGKTKSAMGATSKASTQFETDMRQIMRRANDQAKK